VIKRLARVTNIRQGVLERSAFKMVYLFNELACLREALVSAKERIKSLEKELTKNGARPSDAGGTPANGDKKRSVEQKIAARAQQRTHKVTYIFCVCPAPELLINTTQFWKTQEAKKAFEKMYAATDKELQQFSDRVITEQVQMLKVQPDDSVIPFDDF
jgi:hypothetical protein